MSSIGGSHPDTRSIPGISKLTLHLSKNIYVLIIDEMTSDCPSHCPIVYFVRMMFLVLGLHPTAFEPLQRAMYMSLFFKRVPKTSRLFL